MLPRMVIRDAWPLNAVGRSQMFGANHKKASVTGTYKPATSVDVVPRGAVDYCARRCSGGGLAFPRGIFTGRCGWVAGGPRAGPGVLREVQPGRFTYTTRIGANGM